MRRFVRLSSVLVAVCLLFPGALSHSQQVNSRPRLAESDALRRGFLNPPPSAKARCYWWWLNSYTTTDTITRDLTEMKAKGMEGAILVVDANMEKAAPSSVPSYGNNGAPIGPVYGSPAWMALYLHALKVAADLGMEISLTITDGGNVGVLGGPGVEPADALKLLTFTRTEVAGGSSVDLQLAAPAAEAGFYRPIAVLAYPLRHGAPLPGDPDSERKPILALNYKIAVKQPRGSMELPEKFLPEAPAVAGEQDAVLRDVVDLSAHTSADGTLHWNFPAGQWEVLRIGYTASKERVVIPSGSGYTVDAMNAQAFDHYWDRVIAPILDAGKPYLGKSLRYVVTDSWEAGGANWTQNFRTEFIRCRGYDPVPYLPVVAGRIVESREVSNRFLADLRRTAADLITGNYYDHFAKRAAEYGLGTHPESGGPHGPPIDSLETFRSSAFPQTEFWAASPMHRVDDEDRFFVKDAASAAHIYGKRYVAAEGFSTIAPPWSNSLASNLKPTWDRALTEGLNRLFWHHFTSSPAAFGKPGLEYFADTHLDPNVTWWEQAGPVLLAMNRGQFLMQQGNPVADLLYYYGTQVPNFARLKSDDPAHLLPGYEYDVTNQDALLHRMLSSGGDLRTPEGIHYRALALPASRALAPEDLIWIENYVRQGGVVIGLVPLAPQGLIPAARMAAYKRTADAMWGECGAQANGGFVRYGRGRIFCTQNAHQAFAAMRIAPDFTYSAGDPSVALDFVHRRTAGAEIYFVRNARDVPATATLSFRVQGREPELFDADTGQAAPPLVYRQNGGETDVPLSLPAYGSVFVLFERPAPLHAVSVERAGAQLFPSMVNGIGISGSAASGMQVLTSQPGDYRIQLSSGAWRSLSVAAPSQQPGLQSSWTVSFPSGWGAPPSITMDHLQSWTDVPILGVRYFSGTATYHNTIHVPAQLLGGSHQIWMDLGDVREIATVSVNGKELRTLWHAPFLLRVDPALHAGDNQLAIRVTNLWPNRLIGDVQPSEKIHYTSTNIRTYTRDSPLLPSGLLTPVTLNVVEEAPIR
jgi:hypothetical protein